MPTICFASPKGGTSKSTCSALLSSDLAERGTTVTLIDADPNHPLTKWAKRPGKPEKLTVIETDGEEQLVMQSRHQFRKTAFVIIDLEGTASSAVGVAMSRADLVIIPTKGSDLDAAEAVKAIKFIRFQEKNYRRTIPFAVLFTQTRPAIRPRTQISIETQLREQGIPMFGTQLTSATHIGPSSALVARCLVSTPSKCAASMRPRPVRANSQTRSSPNLMTSQVSPKKAKVA